MIYYFYYVLEEARESDWDSIIACHQGKLSCSTWNYQRSTIGAYFLKPKELKKDDITATVSELEFFIRAFSPIKLSVAILLYSGLLMIILVERKYLTF